MSEERILTHKEFAFIENGERIYRQFIEWRKDGRVIRRGHRMIHEDNRLYRPVNLKYEQVSA